MTISASNLAFFYFSKQSPHRRNLRDIRHFYAPNVVEIESVSVCIISTINATALEFNFSFVSLYFAPPFSLPAFF